MQTSEEESHTESSSSGTQQGSVPSNSTVTPGPLEVSTSPGKKERRLGLAYSLLNFPSPHRLGQSAGIRRSKSLRVANTNAGSGTSSDPPNENLLRPLSLSRDVGAGVEETDFSYPPAKKPRLVCTKANVSTHDEEPLREFSLFLPSKLPSAIPNSAHVLREFVFKITSTYIDLWDFAPHMECIEVRLPSLYDEKLSSSAIFLRDFISLVFQQLTGVQSINDLYVPKVELCADTRLEEIFAGIMGRAAISNLYLPLSSFLSKIEVSKYDLEPFALLLHELHINEIIIVSTNHLIGGFCEKLIRERNKIEECSFQVTYRNEDLDTPGPDYITNLREESTAGEFIDPTDLVKSMNVYSAHRSRVDGSRRKLVISSSKSKSKGKAAFSSDCTYFDEAELTSNSPFASTIWNLERLHNDGIDGTDTVIAIIDSGINFIHPTFKNKILAVKNFVPNKIDNIDCIIDSDGHGTHCAGLAAGLDFFCPTSSDPESECISIPPGVAPGAKLVICKVVKTTDGDVDSDAFIAALHWLKEIHVLGKQKIDVVSISLAATYYSHRQAQVISAMTGLGIIVVCCASNVGRLHLQPIAFPARLGQVLCIGAHDENGKPTSFSPVGRELDFLSPGDNLWGPGPGTKGPFAMDCASGTSCATPAVAGLICLILQAVSNICKKNPLQSKIGGKPLIDLIHNVWVIRELLKVISSSPGHHSDEIGYGTLNPYRLLDRSDEEILRIVNDIVEDE